MRVLVIATLLVAVSCAPTAVPNASTSPVRTSSVAVPTVAPTLSPAPPAPSLVPLTPRPAPTAPLTPAPNAKTVRSLFALNGAGRWTLGYLDERGRLVIAPDGGTAAVTAPPAPVDDVTFVDDLRGWAIGRVMVSGPLPGCAHAGTTCTDVILATTDGGRTWTTQKSVPTTGVTGFTFHGLHFIDALHGFTVEYDDLASPPHADLVATDDGGRTWTVRSSAANDRVFDSVHFVDALHGWAVEGSWWSDFGAAPTTTRLLATSDGGRTWSPQLTGVGVYGINAVDASHAWAIARGGLTPAEIYRTTDGLNWIRAASLDGLTCAGSQAYPPTFVDASRGMIATGGRDLGDAGGVLITQDGGATWSCAASQPTPANATTAPIIFKGSLIVVTRGRDGFDHLMQTTASAATWSERPLPR